DLRLQLGTGFARQTRRFGSRLGQNSVDLTLNVRDLPAIVLKHLFGFHPQRAGIIELFGDRGGTRIQHPADKPWNFEIDEEDDDEGETDAYPEFRIAEDFHR